MGGKKGKERKIHVYRESLFQSDCGRMLQQRAGPFAVGCNGKETRERAEVTNEIDEI
ncbi:hypothetical protein HYC85_019160 [Camellia sinensis]|uniref:Uncharacterized protein n=1 Tax=Camellia sinensis TaxID=4442 RepID=A0A7J7GQ35_CAMSI|nr:hypothetical protein HYC85_019160 [Camellia sinensis]